MRKFVSKSGKEIDIVLPTLDRIPVLLEFVNRLVAEDTFLNLTGNPKTYAEEEAYVKTVLNNINFGKNATYWAIYVGKIIGSVDINRTGAREQHVGRIGLMVDKDYRRDGIGGHLLSLIIDEAKKMNIKILDLEMFSENTGAKKLYEKFGFEVWGRLPEGLYRQGKYSDLIKMYKKIA